MALPTPVYNMTINFKNNFWGYFKFYYSILRNKLVFYLLLSMCVSFLDSIGLTMFLPLLQIASGDSGVEHASGGLRYFSNILEFFGLSQSITGVLVILVVVFLLKGVVKYIQMRYKAKIQYLFIKKIRYILLDDLQNLTYKGYLKLDAGTIQNTLIAEVQRLYQTMNYYFYAAQYVVMLLTYVLFAVLADWKFASLVMLGAGLTSIFYKRIYKLTKKASVQSSLKGNDFNSYLIQAVTYFKYLKVTYTFPLYTKKLKSVVEKTETLNRKMGNLGAISNAFREPIIVVVIAVVIFIQIKYMGNNMSSVLVSLLLFYRALTYLMLVQQFWQIFMQNIGSMELISSLSVKMQKNAETTAGLSYNGFTGRISFSNVSFNYGNTIILNNLSLDIEKNKMVALIGESGSGKSTAANILSSLLQPNNGEVVIDNIPLLKYDKNLYRKSVGYISQEPVVFNDTIFNNVTLWSEPTPENIKRFWEVIKLASADRFILELEEKENTILGDNGLFISGGQKQRISIARELYKNVEILILDEATSALDNETEKVIQENIESLHGKYTILIIAHRLSTIKKSDMIYILSKGSVLDNGTYNDLITRSNIFNKMVNA